MDADFMGGQLMVDLCHGVKLGFNLFLVKGVKEDLDVFFAVK